MKVAVVGAGIAGAAAALAARERGAAVTVFSDGQAASYLRGSAFDVLPLSGDTTLAEQLPLFCEARPEHPYARCLAEDGKPIGEVEWFLKATGIFEALDRDGVGRRVVFADGTSRQAASVQSGVFSYDHDGVYGVASWSPAVMGFGPGLCRTLAAVFPASAFATIHVEWFERGTDSVLPEREVASLFDKPASLERLVSQLRRALGGATFDAVLLPPVVGLEHGHLRWLSEALGVAVWELADPFGGVHGLRLERAVSSALTSSGCHLERGQVRRVVPGPADVRLEAGAIEQAFDAVVLAAGTALGGGFGVDAHGALDCPLLGDAITLQGATEIGASLSAGVATDPTGRVVASGEKVWSDRVFGAGSMLATLDPRDGSGYGACVVSGVMAGRRAAIRAQESC